MQQFAAQPPGAAAVLSVALPPQPPVLPLPPVQPAGRAGQPIQVFSTVPAQRGQDFLDFEKRNEYQTYVYSLHTIKEDLKVNCQEANLKKFLDAFTSNKAQMGW